MNRRYPLAKDYFNDPVLKSAVESYFSRNQVQDIQDILARDIEARPQSGVEWKVKYRVIERDGKGKSVVNARGELNSNYAVFRTYEKPPWVDREESK